MPHTPAATAPQPASADGTAARLAAVEAACAAAAREAGRAPQDITLIAVSKGQDAARAAPALAAGHRTFGENRVREAVDKWRTLAGEREGAALHMIGALQSNKAREAVALFDAIHSVDRESLATALAREMDRQGRRPACFIQVNTGAEPQKGGVAPEGLEALVTLCRGPLALPLAGLMCLPPAAEEPAPHFALLHKLAARHGLEGLSMGMSADYATAIAFGATHLRVGTAIFGPRERK